MSATDLLIAVGALLAAVLGGWPLTAGVLRVAARSRDSGGPERSTDVTGRGTADEPGGGTADAGSDASSTAARVTVGPSGAARAAVPGEGGDGPTGPRATSALRGGTWIGILERVAIAGTVLAGYPAAIAFVIAVKGLGRYPELREHPGTSERFVIGSLASMVWAAAIGGLGRVLILGWPG